MMDAVEKYKSEKNKHSAGVYEFTGAIRQRAHQTRFMDSVANPTEKGE